MESICFKRFKWNHNVTLMALHTIPCGHALHGSLVQTFSNLLIIARLENLMQILYYYLKSKKHLVLIKST